MVAIKDIETLPSCCAKCPFDIFDKCLLTENIICGDRLLKGTEGRLNDCPLVEIEERKVGKWDILGCDLYMCSKCYAKFTHEFNYCPNCGAEMKGAENE